jgi:hypothetical protein
MSSPSITEPAWIRAHRHSSQHRAEILASELCGCFYCCSVFKPSEIEDWVDELPDDSTATDAVGQTALCPRCNVDSVIGSRSGYPVTPEFLKQMHDHWF